MKAVPPLRRGDGTQPLHPKSARDRAQVRRKVAADERHLQIGLRGQGLLQSLAVFPHQEVWRLLGSWWRTANCNVAPAERVVAHARRNRFPHILLSCPKPEALMKFLAPKLDPGRCPNLCLFPLEQAA